MRDQDDTLSDQRKLRVENCKFLVGNFFPRPRKSTRDRIERMESEKMFSMYFRSTFISSEFKIDRHLTSNGKSRVILPSTERKNDTRSLLAA